MTNIEIQHVFSCQSNTVSLSQLLCYIFDGETPMFKLRCLFDCLSTKSCTLTYVDLINLVKLISRATLICIKGTSVTWDFVVNTLVCTNGT